jgi:tagatose-6-phosphate ketose/aldose isomerase
MTLLGLDEGLLAQRVGLATAREIAQQPQTLRAIHAQLLPEASALSDFIGPLVGRRDLRVILTGAGTSAFIGECLVPFLARHLHCRLAAIATTDIVAGPLNYLEAGTPTLLVSFGRSGNSPESVAALELAETLVTECHHLVVTCNGDGALARRARDTAHCHAIILPDATHDRGFAMTSSFTGMMYAALASLLGVATLADRIGLIASAVEAVIRNEAGRMQALATAGFDRVVYLGSNGLKGLACEAALKLLELSDGETIAIHDTPMGFRHGPKTIVSSNTLVVVFVSNEPYTRRYDLDLLGELRRDARARRVLAIAAAPIADVETVVVPGLHNAEDSDLLFAMIVAPQMLAFHCSLALGKTPDNPNAAGLVSRVVKGVTIHGFRQE